MNDLTNHIKPNHSDGKSLIHRVVSRDDNFTNGMKFNTLISKRSIEGTLLVLSTGREY